MELSRLHEMRHQGLPFRISLETVNKTVGLVALGLPLCLLVIGKTLGSCTEINTISHYYFTRLGGDILVGSLFLIGVLLAFFYKMPAPVDGYLGHSKWDIWLARFAGFCAFGIALAPTTGSGCEEFAGTVTRLFLDGAQGAGIVDMEASRAHAALTYDIWATFGVTGGAVTFFHYGSALGMFSVLAYYSLVVFRRPQSATAMSTDEKADGRKRLRNACYLVLGLVILSAVVALILKSLALGEGSRGLVRWNRMNLTFWFEAAALMAFGLSWSIKGRVFDILRDRDDENPRKMPQPRDA